MRHQSVFSIYIRMNCTYSPTLFLLVTASPCDTRGQDYSKLACLYRSGLQGGKRDHKTQPSEFIASIFNNNLIYLCIRTYVQIYDQFFHYHGEFTAMDGSYIVHAQTHPCKLRTDRSITSVNHCSFSLLYFLFTLPIQTCPLHWYTGQITYFQLLTTYDHLARGSVCRVFSALQQGMMSGVWPCSSYTYSTSCNTSK